MQKSRKPLEKEKKAKIFYEHGMDGLNLALSIADTEEGKALRKADKHRQTQEPTSRSGYQHRTRTDKKSRLEKAKAMIAQQRALSKKEKAKSRKERSKWDGARASTARVTIPEPSGATPRKKVTFA